MRLVRMLFSHSYELDRGDAMTAVRKAECPVSNVIEFRESRKFVTIAALNRALCDILCECPRGTHLRGS
jgi:hypothetical protein